MSGKTSFKKLQDGVLERFDITKDELTGRSQCKKLVFARTVIVSLARKHTSLSYTQIGRLMDRDHSTLIASNHRMKELVFAVDAYLDIEATL